MARIASRPEAEDEEEFLEAEETEETELAQPGMPAVSDSRRRRQMKRGEVPVAEAAVPATVGKDRPTPSHREEPRRSRNFLVRFVRSLTTYLRETRTELQKVAWPTREEIRRLTFIVLVVTVVAAAFLGFVSFLFSILTTSIATAETSTAAALLAIGLILVVAGVWLFRDRLFKRIE